MKPGKCLRDNVKLISKWSIWSFPPRDHDVDCIRGKLLASHQYINYLLVHHYLHDLSLRDLESRSLMLTVGNYGALSKHQRKQALTCLYHQHHCINIQGCKIHICVIDTKYRILILKKKCEYEGEHKS